jgi:hypothetical protein
MHFVFNGYAKQFEQAGSVGRALVIDSMLSEPAYLAILVIPKKYFLNALWGSGRYFSRLYTNYITGEQ